MRLNVLQLALSGIAVFSAAHVDAASFTFLTHPSLSGVVTSDPYLGNADDQNFSQFGTNSFGAASQFLASNGTYGFLGGQMTSQGLTAFGPSPQQYFGLNEHTSINMFGEWSLNSAFIFNRAFTQTQVPNSSSQINLARDQTFTTSFELDDGVSGGRLRVTGTGRYLLRYQDAASLYSGDLLTHFQTVQPLLPETWVAVAQEDQFWEVLDGPQAGVTGFTTATFFVEDGFAVPTEPPIPLTAPWETTGFAASYESGSSSRIAVGDPQFGPGAATLAESAVDATDVLVGVGNIFGSSVAGTQGLAGTGSGTLTVSGKGTLLRATSGAIWIGGSEAATMDIVDGAAVSAASNAYIGLSFTEQAAPHASRLTVSGVGSSLTVGSAAYCGGCPNEQSTYGLFWIGADFIAGDGDAELSVSSGGLVEVSGTSSPFNVPESAVLISDAHVAIGGWSRYGLPGGSGHALVDGAGSELSVRGANSAAIDLADGGSATLVVANGGKVTVAALSEARVNVASNPLAGGTGYVRIEGEGSEMDAGHLIAVGASYDLLEAGGTGTLTVANGGLLIADLIFIGQNGTLDGAGGTVQGDVAVHGVLAPGSSPGRMLIDGDLTLEEDGRLIIEIAGPEAGISYDVLDVTGNAALAGTLEIVLLDGYTPEATDSFDFLSALSFAGGFSEFILPVFGTGQTFALAFGPNGFTASVTAVPVPPAAPLLGVGLMALAARVRRGRWARAV